MKIKKLSAVLFAVIISLSIVLGLGVAVQAADDIYGTRVEPALVDAAAEEEAPADPTSTKAIAAAAAVAISASVGAIAMGWGIAKSAESMARQPEAAGKINSAMMLGMVFIETTIIYALIVAILIIFVL